LLLSGDKNDGTAGLKAIKAAGGITFAQNESALFKTMPKAAIAEGVVDKILSLGEMAQELERLGRKSELLRSLIESGEEDEALLADDEATEEIGPSDEDFKPIIQFLRKSVGTDFTYYKKNTIRRRTIRRMLLQKLESLREYASYLVAHPAEAAELYNDLLINVTEFFRDPDTMSYLKSEVLLPIIKRKNPREGIRIWVPACSSGQEAYSLAMLVVEVLTEQGLSFPIQIFATDLSEQAITKARIGTYSISEMQSVSAKRLLRFFTKMDDGYRVNKFIRDMCVFAPHNLFNDPPFSRIDLVSCRNLLIYVEANLQKKAFNTFHYALNTDGFLLLGRSESIGLSTPLFAPVEKNFKVFIRKNELPRRASFDLARRTPEVVDGNDSLMARIAAPKRPDPANDLDKLVDKLLLTQYVPASVVINQDLDILQFRGSTGLFLEPSPGKASLNLLKMARPSLVLELRNAVHKAIKTGQPVRKAGLEIKLKDRSHLVSLEAVPIRGNIDEPLLLILFEETVLTEITGTGKADANNARIKQLERELETLREDMRSIIEEQEASNEELQAANEEIISSNEELQSINEELETSKEEIESTNEELLTINQELQVRNDQLMEAYQYSEAILATIREATVVLDKDLRVRSANRSFYKLFRLEREETEGRLIYELYDRQWNIPALKQQLEEVIVHNGQITNYEMTYRFPDGHEIVMWLNARKVVQHERQHAVLLAIEDITEHKRSQQLLLEREHWFRSIADNAPTLIWVAGPDGRYDFLNKAWLAFTGREMEPKATVDWAKNIHPEDRVAYLDTYTAHFELQQAFQTEYRLKRHDGQYRWIQENAIPLFAPDGVFSGYMGTGAEIHLQKELNQELNRLVRQKTQELAESNDLIHIALTASKAGLGNWDWRTNTTYWDARSREILGIAQEAEAATVDGWLARIHPGDRQAVINHSRESLETGRDFWMEYRVVHPDGSLRYVLGTGRTTKDDQGQPQKLIGLVQDITDLKTVEKHLRQNEALLRSTEELARMGSYEAELPSLRFHFSDGLFRLFGREPQSFEPSLEFLDARSHPDDALKVKNVLEEAARTHQPYYYTRRIYLDSGELRTLEAHGRVLLDEAGKPCKFQGLVQDITDRQRAEAQIQKHLTILKQSEELARTGSWEYNLAEQDFLWSEGMYQLFGLETDAPVSPQLYLDYVLDSDRAIAERVLRQLTVDHQSFEEVLRIRVDGAVKILKIKAVSETDEQGQPTKMLGVDWDVTELIESQSRLQETADNLQAVLNTSPGFIARFSAVPQRESPEEVADFRLTVGNQQLANLSGMPLPELIGQSVERFTDLFWGEQTMDRLREVYTTYQPLYQEKRLTEGPEERWVALSVTRQDESLMTTGLDITELKKAQDQQQFWLDQLKLTSESTQALAELKESLRHRGQLLRTVSHDLRGQVGIISSAAQLLAIGTSEVERNQVVQMILNNVRQMMQLMTSLLDFARLESGEQTRTLSPVDVADLITKLTESVRPQVQQKALALVLEGAEALRVESDPTNLGRIVQNLLLNAIKYTQRGKITVRWWALPAEDRWCLEVSDTGPGLSPGLVARLNTPPESAGESLAPAEESAGVSALVPEQGEGIGLKIVQELVKLLEGRLVVSTEAGQGCRFAITFPLQYTP